MVQTSIMVMCVASLLAEPVAEPTPAPASPDVVETSPTTEPTEPPPSITPEPAAPSCRREDFESFDDYVSCRSRDAGVTPPSPFTAPAPKPVRPTTIDPAFEPELERGVALQTAGSVVLSLGVGSLGSTVLLMVLRGRSKNRLAEGASPGPTGFPAAHWNDLAEDDRRVQRLDTAIPVTLATGAVLVLGGTVALGVGSSWKRWARRHTIQIVPGGLSMRW